MKRSNKTLQNLSYFWSVKTHVSFFHLSFCPTLFFSLINALVYAVFIREINKVGQNDK